MGVPILILGASGSGKSTSLRNFSKDNVAIFNVASKPLPFRGKLTMHNGSTYEQITASLRKQSTNCYVIDDSQYLICFDFFSKAHDKGYGKFTEMALSFYNLIHYVTDMTPEDCIVYFMHHTEELQDGTIKAKTIGKMLDEKLTLEGLFSVVLRAKTDGTQYVFETQSNGFTPCKSPMGMFEDREIENDLLVVDGIIREYWELEPIKLLGE